MKKLLTITLMLLMVGSLIVGCGTQNNSSDGAGSSVSEQVEPNGVDNSASEQVESNEYVPGTRNSSEYVNEEIGLQYTLSEGMAMATNDEINDLMQSGADVMYEDSKTGEQMINYAKVTTIYEMMAINVLDSSNIIVIAEKLALASITETQYADVLKQQFSQTNTAPEFKEVVTEEIDGISFTRLDYTLNTNGVEMQQTMLMKKAKDRMIAIAMSYQAPEQFDALIAGFSALK